MQHLQLARGQLHLRHRLHRVVDTLLRQVLGVLLRQWAAGGQIELIVRRICGALGCDLVDGAVRVHKCLSTVYEAMCVVILANAVIEACRALSVEAG